MLLKTEHNSSKLENRLLSYSLAAGALLVGAQPLNAQVWSFDVNPDVVLDTDDETLSINFNGNNTFDVRYSEQGVSHLAIITEQTGSASWVKNGSGKARALSSGYIVNSTKSFTQNPNTFADKSLGGSFTFGTSWFNADKYIGVKFKIGGSIHYGWIRVHVSVSGNDLQSVTVKDYAYEQTEGLGVEAGSTSSLPVELTTFTAELNNNTAELNWETSTEVNNYGFDVERKNGGNGEWEKVGFVEGNGTTNSPKQYTYTDTDLPNVDQVTYRLRQIDNDGSVNYSKEVTVDLSTITDVKNQRKKVEFTLGQNYPNPFNPSTTINFSLPESGNVRLTVFNSLGQEVKTLLQEQLNAGEHIVNFIANGLPSGFYTYRIDIDGKYNSTKKMLLIK